MDNFLVPPALGHFSETGFDSDFSKSSKSATNSTLHNSDSDYSQYIFEIVRKSRIRNADCRDENRLWLKFSYKYYTVSPKRKILAQQKYEYILVGTDP